MKHTQTGNNVSLRQEYPDGQYSRGIVSAFLHDDSGVIDIVQFCHLFGRQSRGNFVGIVPVVDRTAAYVINSNLRPGKVG